MYLELTFFSYIIDKVFGEFSFIRFYKHPVIFMGEFIKWFEKNFYQNTIFRGSLLTVLLISITCIIIFCISSLIQNIIILSILGSMTIASKMLFKSVKNVIDDPQSIKYLVSRDTHRSKRNDINKAAIETYAENLSDGVIAPLFYMLFFGLYGAFIYKAVNTLDSMIGYRNDRYENFGKFAAKLDDILNYIPSRLTAILIALLFCTLKALSHFYHYGKLHKSPNAGHPISAMALSLNITLGGPTSYFGKIEQKPYFGNGKQTIASNDILRALKFNLRFDIVFLLILGVIIYA
jgi:adenosylcobinamide-phosphate synthase